MADLDRAVDLLRAWLGDEVLVRLDPDGAVMRGLLREADAAGLDGAAFALEEEGAGTPPTGVAIALFRDAVRLVATDERQLVVEQGRVRITVRRCQPG